MTKSFAVLRRKIAEYSRAKMPLRLQLAVIDWWIGQLFQLRARIEARRRD